MNTHKNFVTRVVLCAGIALVALLALASCTALTVNIDGTYENISGDNIRQLRLIRGDNNSIGGEYWFGTKNNYGKVGTVSGSLTDVDFSIQFDMAIKYDAKFSEPNKTLKGTVKDYGNQIKITSPDDERIIYLKKK